MYSLNERLTFLLKHTSQALIGGIIETVASNNRRELQTDQPKDSVTDNDKERIESWKVLD